mmetsp:Transcript_100805/g.325357  ORF Transcript_100805/g.325357 Transcript_100805/m.325357 type:complete len:231 (+) Transcript_100805:862-1554(+)
MLELPAAIHLPSDPVGLALEHVLQHLLKAVARLREQHLAHPLQAVELRPHLLRLPGDDPAGVAPAAGAIRFQRLEGNHHLCEELLPEAGVVELHAERAAARRVPQGRRLRRGPGLPGVVLCWVLQEELEKLGDGRVEGRPALRAVKQPLWVLQGFLEAPEALVELEVQRWVITQGRRIRPGGRLRRHLLARRGREAGLGLRLQVPGLHVVLRLELLVVGDGLVVHGQQVL